MRPPAAAFAFLAAALLSGCNPERGYFQGGNFFERGYVERGYFPGHYAAPQPAVAPEPMWPQTPREPAAPQRPTYVPSIDDRVPQHHPLEPTEPATAVPAPAPTRIAPAPAAEPFAPIPAEARRPRRTPTAPGVADPRAPGGPPWRPPVLQPRTPEVGSPEWEREKVETERRERDLNRTLRGICSGC